MVFSYYARQKQNIGKQLKTYLKGVGDAFLLHFVKWRWDTLEHLQVGKGLLSPGGLVGNHTTNCTVEDVARSTEMEWTTGGLYVTPEQEI